MAEHRAQRLAERLAGRTLLITGATGYLGKAVLATCLERLPELGEIRLLIKAGDDGAAHERLGELVETPVLRSTGAAESALEAGRLSALAGDLTADELGRDSPPDLAGIDAVIHCAASVSFEDPLDYMLELNVLGPRRLVRALRAGGALPTVGFVHISTAYAAGSRTGLVLERPAGRSPGEPEVELAPELDAARAWRRELESESRLPVHQQRFMEEARREIGPAGAPAVAVRAEAARRAWVGAQLSERGRERSRALGFSDAYGLSKALGERVLLEEDLHALTIIRPSVMESALRYPYPGWIEGLKVADPVILAYARGLIPRFPGNPSARLDLVPVDLVANACIAAAAHPPDEGVRTLALASGARRPVSVEEVGRHIDEYFSDRPLPGEDGLPIEVPGWRFTTKERALAALDRGEHALEVAQRWVDRVPLPRRDDAEQRLHRERRQLERLRRLAEIYGPYIELDSVFDDRNAQELLAQLHPDDREAFDFDTAAIDWSVYLKEIHLPALRELIAVPRVRARSTARPRPETDGRPAAAPVPHGPPAPAFFDVEGVVLDTTIAHFYAWLRTQDMPVPDRALWSLSLLARAPGYLAADRRSRSRLARRFYRNYRGLPAAELREQAADALSDFILPRINHDAVRRIRAHRRRGDRVVLLTGALDFLVAPLEHLADELVAARLTERGGAFTGELAEPPLTADGRASLAASLAADQGAELSDCHAYADSTADLPLLELVGHPHAVNPDFRLAREARRRGWPLLRWKTEPGARTRPLAGIGT